MAESHGYTLRIQQSKLDGWWFIFVDEVPELGVLGPNYEALLDRLKNEAEALFRSRGEKITDIEILRSEKPTLRVFH
jgi:predicted RNase H-like HicB family nuclease